MANRTAYIFENVDGYHWCEHNEQFLDARGKAYKTKADAMRAAAAEGYTHAEGSGTYWDGIRKIPAKYREW